MASHVRQRAALSTWRGVPWQAQGFASGAVASEPPGMLRASWSMDLGLHPSRTNAEQVRSRTSVMLFAIRWVSLVFTAPSVTAAGAASARTARRRGAARAARVAACTTWPEVRRA